MEKEREICHVGNNVENIESSNEIFISGSSSSTSTTTISGHEFTETRKSEEIKKNLNWMRWTEYSPYAKDIIKNSEYPKT